MAEQGDGPAARDLLEAQLVALAVHVERGGQLAGVGRVLKRVAVEMGVPGADRLPLPALGQAAAMSKRLEVARQAVHAALDQVEGLWRDAGVAEALPAAAGLEAVEQLLSCSDRLPLPARSVFIAGVEESTRHSDGD